LNTRPQTVTDLPLASLADHGQRADDDREIRAERTRLLFRQVPTALWANAVTGVAVVAVSWQSADGAVLLGWLCLLGVVSGMRFWLLRSFLAADPAASDMPRWEHGFVAGAAATGICWGLAGLAVPLESMVQRAFFGLILAGATAGAASVLASSRRAFLAFALPAILPYAIGMMLAGDAVAASMGAAAVVFVSLMVAVIARIGQTLEEALRLRFRNAGLVASLSETNRRLETTNEALAGEVGERRAAQEVLRRSEEKLRLHLEQSPLAFIEWDLGFRAIEWNPAAERIFGFSRQQALGKRASELIAGPGACADIAKTWQRLMRDRQGASLTMANRTRDGREITCEWHYTPVIGEQGRVISVITLAQDVTDSQRAQHRLHYLAYYDDLTGLANRALFNDRLAHALAEAKRAGRHVGVLLLDLDNFKVVNDTLGHAQGNALLVEVAQRVCACVRETDTVGRFGGDEFGVVIGDLSEAQHALAVAQKILDGFAAPFRVAGREVYLATSVGVAFYPDDAADADTLIMSADAALHHAKAQGRNNCQFYSAELTRSAQRRLDVETRLRRALEREEFVVHYQPRVSIETGQVTGVEALLRWQDPERGMVSPLQFIGIAEESGAIVPIGDWVLQRACEEVSRWHAAGLSKLRLAVNLSSRQFRQPRLLETVDRVLLQTGYDPALLEFEITESVLLDDDPGVSRVLFALRERGIAIAIDDFGTGYSSLSYLKRFPVDILKIDQTFVQGLPVDMDDLAIVRAIVAMARSLRLRTVAEGVEQDEQVRFLRGEGCEEVQGFLYGAPVAAEDLTRRLRMGGQVSRP
jgi:diguanylate cyclase (GGDEF)-like protein/PAS domain S-box-containing protein